MQAPPIPGRRYVLESELERTDTVAVWRATDRVLDRPVAVRVLLPHLAEDDGARGRFLAAAGRASVVSSPHVVDVFDVGPDGRAPFVVTEFVDGERLRDLLDREGPLDHTRALELVLGVLAALDVAHHEGVAHGDLRPERALVGTDGRVRLEGFGMATVTDPEGSEDPRADLRAAGAILYEAVTGRPPDPGDPLPPGAVRPGIPRDLEVVMLRALDPGEGGFATATAFASAVRRLRAEPPTPPAAGDWLAEASRPSEPSAFRSWMLVPLLLGIGVAIVLGGAVALGRLDLGLDLPGGDGGDGGDAGAARPLEIATVRDHDPLGDGTESPRSVASAIDGDEATPWTTEDYYDGTLNKAGVGLLLDLGEPARLEGVRVFTSSPGFDVEVKVGDDPDAIVDAPALASFTTQAGAPVEGLEPARGRFVLVWVTSVVPLPDGSHRAVVNEIEVLGVGG